MEDEDKQHLLEVLQGREARARRVYDVAHNEMCKNPGDDNAKRVYYQSRGALNEIRDLVRWIEEGWYEHKR